MKYRIVVESVNGAVICGEAKELDQEQLEGSVDLLNKTLGAADNVLQLKANNNFHSFRADNIVRASVEAVE